MSSTGWRSLVHAVLVDRGRVLLVPSGDGWALPSVELDGDAEEDLSLAARPLEKTLGAPATVLRYADRVLHRDRRLLELVYVLEHADRLPEPPGATWVGRAELSGLTLSNAGHGELLDRLLRDEELPVPTLRAPWAREGWLTEARDWIERSLAGIGRPLAGPVEQLKSWCLSCLLRVPTAGGAVYFKATAASPLFVDEGTVMRGLARLFPGSVPEPLAAEPSRRWMLLDDLGPELGWDAPVEFRELVHRRFARIQVESSRRLPELLALGCVDRRLERLATQIQDLLADDASLAGLESAEVERLRTLEPRFVSLCLGLAEQGVPDALVHGDLHLGNVARIEDRYVVFDWTDACVTHPFFDLIDVFREQDEAVKTRLRDTYLSEWLEFAPMHMLLTIWSQAELLASLHHAVSYRSIAASVEPGTGRELEWALPELLRRVLAADL